MALQLEDRRARPDQAADTQLGRWLSPLHLRLRLVSADAASQPGSHGWLEDEGRLVLHRRALLERLRRLPGYGRWTELGGQLHLAEEVRP